MKYQPTFIYGRHAVLEAMRQRPDIIRTLHMRTDLKGDEEIRSLISAIPDRQFFAGNKVPRGVDKDSTHQGLIAEIDPGKLLVPFRDWRDTLPDELDASTAVVVLGEVQDPHNVGAIIRSAAALGVAAVLIPEHRQAPVTGTVIKVSAGTAFTIPLVHIGNTNAALRDLKEKGFWAYGLAGDGDTLLPDEKFTRPSVFVVGNEASGIRLKTHELCDTILTIPMSKRAESLNASVSAAIAMYAWSVLAKLIALLRALCPTMVLVYAYG